MKPADTQGDQVGPDGLLSREKWLEPFEWYQEMREESPVRYDPKREVWDVFRYDDIKTLLENNEELTSNPQKNPEFDESDGGAKSMISETMVQQDPPRHGELRSVVEDAFRPSVIKELEPTIRGLANDILDELLADNPDQIDIVNDVASPLPVFVIAELLGIPEEKHEEFRNWSDAFVLVPDGTKDEEAFSERQQAMVEFFIEMIADRRENPQDDLVSRIATAEMSDGSLLSPREAFSMCALLLVAGNVTVRNLLTNSVWCLTEQDLHSELDEGDLGTYIEEVLRYRSPIQTTGRIVMDDVTVQGETIEAGNHIICWLGSANRDQSRFDDPNSFDPYRAANQHLGFGHGIHYCLGAPLARLQAKIVISELLDRWESLGFAERPLQPVRNPTIHGLDTLPIEFEMSQ